jgi:hypothetical protein
MLSVLLKLGSQRVSDVSARSHDRHNHREADERIFHALVDSVLKSWDINDYTLRGHELLENYQLAKSNYGDKLFIHPPIFVYLSALLHSFGVR